MASLFVEFEPTGVAILGRVVPSKVTEREAGVIKDEVTAAAAPAGWRVALDLTGVTFLASSGLGALLAINRSCRDGGGRLAVFGICPDILGVLKVAKLDRVLEISADRDSALKAFK